MKKFMTDIKTLAALLMAGAAFTACSSSDDNIIEQPQNPTEPKVYTMVIKASKGTDTTTRALKDVSGEIKAFWSGTETIEVGQYNYATEKYDIIGEATAAYSPNGNTTITATLTYAPDPDKDLNFFLGGSTLNFTGQVGLLTGTNSISEKYDYASDCLTSGSFTVDEINNKVIPNKNNSRTLEFRAAEQAIIKFTLKDKANNEAISPTAFTVSDGTNTVELTSIPTTTYDTNGDGVLYVAFPPGAENTTITLTATVGDDTYTYTTPSTKTFWRGQYYEITVKMKKITDLSMVDCAGNDRASRWTANCYMVQTAGNYKLPLVYGNAIKNGADNTVAYNPGGTTSNTYCANFVNHAGTAINAPWITKSTGGTGVNKGMGINVNSAELLWEDAQGLITAVGISGDYLTLTVGKDAATREGNAVIAAKDAGGTIVWSWHIWVTKQTFANLTTVATGSHDYQLTPVNLGWVGDAESQGYNTYYQWGRKDAFIPSTGTDNTNHTVYDINGAEVTNPITYSDDEVGIDGNIKNPTTFYNKNYKPSNVTYYNLWDAQQTDAGNNIATATKKTVYDPCPAGFCVPTGNLYYYIKKVGVSFEWDSTNKGRNLTSVTPNVFFPASGYRSNGSGSLSDVGSYGCCWSASGYSSSNYYARSLRFYSSNCSWSFYYRSYGCPVRAVAEE